ncbi:Alpha/Beta hydrolase protein [Xylariaceae sp. FL0016]|nr:Alpha/Beta hydrolase protein [Xylariaceae sp. FL0016]
MQLTQLVSCAIYGAASALVASHQQYGRSSGLSVATTSGEVHGFINETAPNVRQFLGIPYAEPPVGKLRFLPPVAKKDAGPIEATTYAPACMQQSTPGQKTVYTEFMQQFLIEGGDSEDCLYVNVYAPLNPTSEKLPVLIYIPGGGFTSGGSNSLYKIPDKWIEKTQSHIVIVMQYRLNVFGYPKAQEYSLNSGLLDQRLVVEWAQDNIANFGGDSEKMTLWGQSAGAGSVSYYLYSYLDDPIVHAFIADSGAPSSSGDTDPTNSNFTALAGLVGCDGLAGPEEFACMQNVDAVLLEETLSNNSASAHISFTPRADGLTVFSNYTDRISQGQISKLPLLTGTNANEGAGFGTFSPDGLTPGQYELGLAIETCPVSAEVEKRVKYGLTTYRYEYAGNFSNISPRGWIGASHSSELPLIFGTHYEYRGNSTEFEWEVSDAMQALWLSFATDPSVDPTNGGDITWPKYAGANSSTLAHLATDDEVVQWRLGSTVNNLCDDST